jgi:Ca2+-binding EF-hand superfamily protein
MRTIFTLFSVVAVALALQSSLTADEPSKKSPADDPGALFDRLDANHDGQLTADEIPAEKHRLFERLLRLAGKDANGKLSRDEFIAQLNAAAEEHAKKAQSLSSTDSSERPLPDAPTIFDRLDAKHTGKVTLDDVPKERQGMFKQVLTEAGKPEGGSLTKDEFVKAFQAWYGKQTGRPVPAGDTATLSEAGPGIEPLLKRLMQLSKRSDGKLTKDELPERMRDKFDRIDANHDGLIDETELRQWLTLVKQRRDAAAQAGSPLGSKAAPQGKPTNSK